MRGNCQCCGVELDLMGNGRVPAHRHDHLPKSTHGVYPGFYPDHDCMGSNLYPMQQNRRITDLKVEGIRSAAAGLRHKARQYAAGSRMPPRVTADAWQQLTDEQRKETLLHREMMCNDLALHGENLAASIESLANQLNPS